MAGTFDKDPPVRACELPNVYRKPFGARAVFKPASVTTPRLVSSLFLTSSHGTAGAALLFLLSTQKQFVVGRSYSCIFFGRFVAANAEKRA